MGVLKEKRSESRRPDSLPYWQEMLGTKLYSQTLRVVLAFPEIIAALFIPNSTMLIYMDVFILLISPRATNFLVEVV